MRYQAIDTYEYYEIMFESDDYRDCYHACKGRIEDTDGECYVFILDTETGLKYNFKGVVLNG
jgi:hypothetical protein